MKFLFIVLMFIPVTLFADGAAEPDLDEQIAEIRRKSKEGQNAKREFIKKTGGSGQLEGSTLALLMKLDKSIQSLEAKEQVTYLTPQNMQIAAGVSAVLFSYVVVRGIVAYRRLRF